jgi:hypothetical protein
MVMQMIIVWKLSRKWTKELRGVINEPPLAMHPTQMSAPVLHTGKYLHDQSICISATSRWDVHETNRRHGRAVGLSRCLCCLIMSTINNDFYVASLYKD